MPVEKIRRRFKPYRHRKKFNHSKKLAMEKTQKNLYVEQSLFAEVQNELAEKNQSEKLELEKMSIAAIARLIRKDWKKVDGAAKPYLAAMLDIEKITDKYYQDEADGVVLRFLGNAASWRGDIAKQVKAYLRKLCGQ